MISFKELSYKVNQAAKTDTATKILSIVAAIIIWFVISVIEYPTMEKRLSNIEIVVDTAGTYAEANSLQVIAQHDMVADVRINGKRNKIGNFESSEIKVVADTSAINSPGTYRLPLEVENNSDKEFTVDEISPRFVTVDVERIITREFEVTADIDGSIGIAEGYMRQNPIFVSENTVAVTGPEKQLDSITEVRVVVSSSQPLTLSSSYEFITNDIRLYNNGVQISTIDSNISFDKTDFTVQIPIYFRQSIPLEVKIRNEPEGFDVESFKASLLMSASELEIAAPTDAINDITSLNIGTINMREVDIGSTFTFDINSILPDGYENLSGLNTVTVTCPSENLSKKLVAIRGSKIQIINKPSQYDFEMITSTLMPYFIGPSDQIEALTSTDVVCQIDMLSATATDVNSPNILPVTFSLPDYDDIWINAGSASLNVYVQITPKEE